MKRSTYNNIIIYSGSFAIGCAATAMLDKIDKMEETKFTKGLYRVGTWCGVVAAGRMVLRAVTKKEEIVEGEEA